MCDLLRIMGQTSKWRSRGGFIVLGQLSRYTIPPLVLARVTSPSCFGNRKVNCLFYVTGRLTTHEGVI